MKNLYSKKDLIALLRASHEALEEVTERVGCDFKTAVVLVDCENFLSDYDFKKVVAPTSRAFHVH